MAPLGMITAVIGCGLVIAAPMAVAQATNWVERPFNGKNLDGWSAKPRQGTSAWVVGTPKLDATKPEIFAVSAGNALVNDAKGYGQSWDLFSNAKWGDAYVTLEVMVPKGSNSGIYLMGEYEVQVLDSFGKDANPGTGDMAALYGAAPPKNPTYRAPGEWNQIAIWFRAPRFDAQGKKTENAKFIRVDLNGKTVHENVEMQGPTPAGLDGKEKPVGPLMFQGDHGPVAYRNIRVRPLPR